MAGKQRKWGIATLVAVGVLGIGSGMIYRVSSSRNPESASQGSFREAPPLELKDASGKAHSLAEAFSGNVKLVIVHFWAHWCPPCIEEIPKFTEFARSPNSAAYRFIAVSEDPTWNDAHQSLPSTNLPPSLTSVIDPENKVSERYGTYQFPETYLLKRTASGKIEILTKWVGPQDWGGAEVSTALARLASDHE